MAKGEVDCDTNSFIIILMATGFVFNRATHLTYADVSASELGTGNGYTAGTKALAGIAITRNDTLYKVTITWSSPQWTAAGGPIGPANSAIIYDDTHASDIIVGYIDFGGDGTEPDGGVFTIPTPTVELTT